MAHIGMANIVMAYKIMAYIVIASLVMAYLAMAYIVMAYLAMTYRRSNAAASWASMPTHLRCSLGARSRTHVCTHTHACLRAAEDA